jgi:hypothetical protein
VKVNNEQRASAILTDELKSDFEQYWSENEDEQMTGNLDLLDLFRFVLYS